MGVIAAQRMDNVLPADKYVWMEETRLFKTEVMHVQDR